MATKKVQQTPEEQKKLLSSLNTKLASSPTAYTTNTNPTSSDLKLQLQLMNLNSKMEKESTAAKKAALYGDDSAVTDINNPLPPKEGWISRGLHALSAPLYGIVGGVEALTGKGTKPGLANIPANIKEHGTFGDLLKNGGVNKWAAMPLGFALDVAFDPINWATAGTTAMVPKLYKGLRGGGVEGFIQGAKSAGFQKAGNVLRWTPWIDRSLTGDGLVAKIASKYADAEDAFRSASGLPSMIEEVVANSNKPRWADAGKLVDKLAEAGVPGAKWFQKGGALNYSPNERWASIKNRVDKDVLETAGEIPGEYRTSLDDVIQELSNASYYGKNGKLSETLERSMRQRGVDNLTNEATKVAFTPPAKEATLRSSFDVQHDFSNLTDDLKRANAAMEEQIRGNIDNTGIEWYDKLRGKANNSKFAGKVLDSYEKMMGWFKVTKVGLNPTSYMNAVLGNATMAGMTGVDITNPQFLDTIKQTFALVRGKTPGSNIANAIAASPELQEFITKYSKLANEINLDKSIFEGGINRAFGNDLAILANQARKGGSKEDLLSFAKQLDISMHPSSLTLETPSLFNNDIFYGSFNSMIQAWSQQPAGIRKSVANFINKSATAYGSIDQTFKIGTLLHLHLNGVSARELKTLARFVPLAEKDITKVGNLYKISAMKAGQIANESFMNYAAMPSAIRLLRSIPLLGSPFASFTYGALARTGKTAVRNPSFFNKVTFARDEVSHATTPTPLEKQALGSPYYNYLNSYGRVKLPFFKSYPTYLNVANWLPYLGLNIFNQTDRQYTSEVGNTVGGVFDKMPFLKTPEGQILFDYIIQPYVLGEQQPSGQFGQPLYAEDATTGDKLKSGGKAVLQAYVPPWLPPGYRFTQLLNAVQGKSAQGLPSKKSGYELTSKALLSTGGVPINDIDLNAFSSVVRKQLEPSKDKK